jgi:hypothetical protein
LSLNLQEASYSCLNELLKLSAIANEITQGITEGFTKSGFKTQVQPLSAFHESYGLEGDEGEDEHDDDEDEEMEDGVTEGSEHSDEE